ncbi:unnamed protein product [Prorocentrum cordatum]|uniref:Uncharacterized protein n=1 Tax=Prorocentrum cordatum TaxID=2364126 RepID=A0ABN9R5G4_9DINO|nr:unnamed protein product [Polarella glacialis]
MSGPIGAGPIGAAPTSRNPIGAPFGRKTSWGVGGPGGGYAGGPATGNGQDAGDRRRSQWDEGSPGAGGRASSPGGGQRRSQWDTRRDDRRDERRDERHEERRDERGGGAAGSRDPGAQPAAAAERHQRAQSLPASENPGSSGLIARTIQAGAAADFKYNVSEHEPAVGDVHKGQIDLAVFMAAALRPMDGARAVAPAGELKVNFLAQHRAIGAMAIVKTFFPESLAPVSDTRSACAGEGKACVRRPGPWKVKKPLRRIMGRITGTLVARASLKPRSKQAGGRGDDSSWKRFLTS